MRIYRLHITPPRRPATQLERRMAQVPRSEKGPGDNRVRLLGQKVESVEGALAAARTYPVYCQIVGNGCVGETERLDSARELAMYLRRRMRGGQYAVIRVSSPQPEPAPAPAVGVGSVAPLLASV